MAYEDIVDILEHCKKYVPCKTVILSEPLPGTDCTEDKEYVHTLIGGDYLSVARARGAQHIRRTSELEIYRLDGLLPVTEDWHAKVCLLEVCKINICVFCIKLFFFFFFFFFLQVFWKRLFKTTSGTQKGTLCQLRKLINRRNVTKRPKSDVNAAEDFVEVVVISHVLTAVMTYLEMSSFTDAPSCTSVPENLWMEDEKKRRDTLECIANRVVDEHIDLEMTFLEPNYDACGTTYDYACEVLMLGLFIFDFKDAVREGDGDHIITLWKYMMLFFKATGRTKRQKPLHYLLSVTSHFLLICVNRSSGQGSSTSMVFLDTM